MRRSTRSRSWLIRIPLPRAKRRNSALGMLGSMQSCRSPNRCYYKSAGMGLLRWISAFPIPATTALGRRTLRVFYINCCVNIERLGLKCRLRGAFASNPLRYQSTTGPGAITLPINIVWHGLQSVMEHSHAFVCEGDTMNSMDVRDAVKDAILKKSPGRLYHRWNNLAIRRVALQMFSAS